MKAARKPSRPRNPKRATKPHHVADPMANPLDRAYAQQLRKDRTLSFTSATKRANFWASRMKELAHEEQVDMEQNVAQLTQQNPRSNTSFAGANLQGATLNSSPPANPGRATIAGLGEGGIAPPPPPA